MVDDDVFLVPSPCGVALVHGIISHPHADEADDDVVGVDPQGIVLQADSVPGSCLAGDSDVPVVDVQVSAQLDGSAHVEDNGAGTLVVNGPAEGTLAVVVEVGNTVHVSSASTCSEHSAALGSREGPCQFVVLVFGKTELGNEFIGNFGGLGQTSGNAFHGLGEFRVGQSAVASYGKTVGSACDKLRQNDRSVLCGAGRMQLAVSFLQPPVIVVGSIHGTPGKCQGCLVGG